MSRKHSPLQNPTLVPIDRQSVVPLHRQLYVAIRQAVLEGRFQKGARLPSTRALARELGVSRNTVLAALDQLHAEGFVRGHIGAGTYVVESLPDDMIARAVRASVRPVRHEPRPSVDVCEELGERGRYFHAMDTSWASWSDAPRPFRAGIPAFDAFPFDLWRRIASRYLRRPPGELLGYGSASGHPVLREAIASYLRSSRGVRCDAEQVFVVGGAIQGLDLLGRVLLDPRDVVWMEEPGWIGARSVFKAAGARVYPIPVDADGMRVPDASHDIPVPRLIFTTPSCQFPLGTTMGASRRLELLEWTIRHGAWLVEDDFDSELRYAGRPLQALQGIDPAERVLYLGSFSKVLFPGLRLAYLVVPQRLVPALTSARVVAGFHSPMIDQAVLADFIREGHFLRHLRRMRALYAERQQALVESVRAELSGILAMDPVPAGMRVIGWLPPGTDDREVVKRAAAEGVELIALSSYYAGACPRPGVVFGYPAFAVEDIRRAVHRLARALRTSAVGQRSRLRSLA